LLTATTVFNINIELNDFFVKYKIIHDMENDNKAVTVPVYRRKAQQLSNLSANQSVVGRIMIKSIVWPRESSEL